MRYSIWEQNVGISQGGVEEEEEGEGEEERRSRRRKGRGRRRGAE
jgi:hypothetical protein